MAEILTESFCERCGTRYTFEATTRRRLGIGRIRRLSRGMRNFVANDDASFSEAMATAREDDTRSASSRQLDAFHRSFNFCMSCRQYTCRNCWNSGVGECLSCAPDLGVGVLPAASPDLAVIGPETHASTLPESAQFAESAHPNVAASAWPTSDLRAAPEAAAVADLPTAKLIDATEPDATEPDATEPVTEIDATALVTETELTPEELVAIHSALTRHVGRPDGGRAPLPAGSEEPAELDVAEIPRAAVEAAPIVAEPGGTPQPTAGARLETRRLLQRFRPRRDRATPVARSTASTGPTADAVAVAAPAVAAIVVESAVAAVAAELTAAEPAVVVEPAAAAVAIAPAVVPKPAAAQPAAAVPEVAAAAPEPPSMAPKPAAEPPSEPPPAAALEPAAAPEPPSVAPEPAAAAPEPPSEPPPAAAPASPLPDVAVQPTWSMVAPDGAPPGEPRSATPAWATPQRLTRREADAMPSAPWAARVATARPLESPVWAASSRHILTAAAPGAAGPVGIQSCVSCGLSLSANARFCRRCGTRQA